MERLQGDAVQSVSVEDWHPTAIAFCVGIQCISESNDGL